MALCAKERQSDKRRILVNIHGCLPWIIWQMYHYKGNICTIYKCVQWIYFNHTSTTIHIRTCSVSSLFVHAWIRRHSTEQMGRRARISLLAHLAQPRPRLVTRIFDFGIDSRMFSWLENNFGILNTISWASASSAHSKREKDINILYVYFMDGHLRP